MMSLQMAPCDLYYSGARPLAGSARRRRRLDSHAARWTGPGCRRRCTRLSRPYGTL